MSRRLNLVFLRGLCLLTMVLPGYANAAQLPGDVNGDGQVDITDALATLQYVVGLIPHNAANDATFLAADVWPLDPVTRLPKGDGQVNISDALEILRHAVNLDPWIAAGQANVLPITVNGALCSTATSAGYFNKPCVSVTICNPGTSTCQTVNDILLDTGSYGLRVFNSAIPGLTLPQVPSGSGTLAECINFADGSSIWGPVRLAGVQLGGEAAVQVPIQVIDNSFGTPSSCGLPDPDPVTAGYTGILGIGPFAEDCGSFCASRPGNGIYFSCTGPSCSGAAVSIANQVQNPVASLPVDNNGMLVQLPGAHLGGVPSLSGSLILGIGTQANNSPASPTVFPTNQFGDFRTVFNGINSNNSFADTGSNGLFFPSALPACSGSNSAWYCPPATQLLSATIAGTSGSPSEAVTFNVGNFSTLISSNNNEVFSEIGGPAFAGSGFDWGLPFFLGRAVFIGIGGSVLGNGPFVAF